MRNGYVSNSSSSSFVIWGKNALNYILTIKDGLAIETREMAQRIFWKIKKRHYYDPDDESVECISDDDWKRQLNDCHIRAITVPESIYDGYSEIDKYENRFIEWFCKNYDKERFFKITASDHDGETKYLENEMEEKIRKYNGPYMIFNNH